MALSVSFNHISPGVDVSADIKGVITSVKNKRLSILYKVKTNTGFITNCHPKTVTILPMALNK